MLGKADTIPVRVLEKVLAELLLRHRLFQVVGAPLVIGAEQVGRPGRLLRVKADIRIGLHELVEVTAVLHSNGKVLPGTFAQGETVLIRQKPLQPFQCPEQNAGQFLRQLVDQVRVIGPAFRLVLDRDQNLPPPETIAGVVGCNQIAVAEAEQPGIEQALGGLSF